MEELQAETSKGINYGYYKCSGCGEETVNMRQLHKVAEKHRLLKKIFCKTDKMEA